MDRNEMSNLYRGHAIDASYQVSLHSANQKQELPLAAMFVNGSGQNEQSLERTFHRCFLPSSLHLAEGFQRRRLKCEKLTNDGRQVMAKAHIAFGKVS